VIACVGGGSNAIGIFTPFVDDAEVALIGVEAAGRARTAAATAPRCGAGDRRPARLALLGDRRRGGQILEAHSISAGLDYPGRRPRARAPARHRPRHLRRRHRRQALAAFAELSRLEGIIPALESSHAIAWLLRTRAATGYDVLCLSGRGDKDLAECGRRWGPG
jgi:tryptophan synthase beta chain